MTDDHDEIEEDLREELENLDPTGEGNSPALDMDVTEQEFVLGRAGKGRPSKRCEDCGEEVTGYVQDENSGRVLCFNCSDPLTIKSQENGDN